MLQIISSPTALNFKGHVFTDSSLLSSPTPLRIWVRFTLLAN